MGPWNSSTAAMGLILSYRTVTYDMTVHIVRDSSISQHESDCRALHCSALQRIHPGPISHFNNGFSSGGVTPSTESVVSVVFGSSYSGLPAGSPMLADPTVLGLSWKLRSPHSTVSSGPSPTRRMLLLRMRK